MGLTDKQRVFVKEYMLDLNATQAAIRAGYNERSARSQGQRLLTNDDIQKALQSELANRSQRVAVTADRVLSEIAKIAFSDVRKIFNADGSLIPISSLDDEAAACIAGCDLVTVNKGEGEVEYVAKVKMADKLKALELAGKHLGLFKENQGAEDLPMPTRLIVEVVDGRKPALPAE
jgi:phage terminase small subunit